MILAKARLIEAGHGRLRVGLSFPTGFDPDEVLPDSVRANGAVVPDALAPDPRRGSVRDIYRELEVSFPEGALSGAAGTEATLKITGRFRKGHPFAASVRLVGFPPRPADH